MEIPFHKPCIGEDEISEVLDTLRSGWITMGPKTMKFEEEFSRYIGSSQAVAVNSGTAALHLALKAVGLKAGDEVIIPTTTFTSTGEVVCYFNAKPVIVDVNRETHNIDVASIAKAITSKTRAIIPVHFGGQPCDMDEILEIAGKHKLYVIEDAAHALPARYKGERIGRISNLTCFSFYSTKPLAMGEGGLVTTENGEWADRIRTLRLHGISKDAWKRYSKGGSWFYEVVEAGYKYNTTDLQAALGLAQLKKVGQLWNKRKSIARRYTEAFSTQEGIHPPVIRPDRETAWHLYVVKLNLEILKVDRNTFIEKLREKGIQTSVHFIPLHRHPFYRDTFGVDAGDYPNAEWIFKRSISLPIYPGMSDEEVNYVIETTESLLRSWKR
jgi:dTDP-4-amino-4,6-dideoxygalactose transaminase